jgi:LmbE family N-acetylglucosaminyl deacetylase
VPFTLVAFHAHPDDEALLTAGTMARAATEGHRVVLAVATAGGSGLVGSQVLGVGESLADRRLAELGRSATVLGCARVELLGYADSGLDGTEGGPEAFARADVEEAASRLAKLLVEEDADALTVYDPAGGYGHPDHLQVHRVGSRAAELAGTPVVLEATVPRDLIARAVRAVGRVYRFPPEFDPTSFERAFSPGDTITHRVDVRRYAVRKRVAMASHASQATVDGGDRTLAAFGRLPMPVFREVFGHEWFVEHGRVPGRPLDDIFATARTGPASS